MARTNNFCHLALTVLVMRLASAAAAHPLEDAAYEAATLCTRLDGVETIEQCLGNVAPSPHRIAAKAALQRMFKMRAAFMRMCDTERGMIGRCQEQAEVYIWAGASRDFTWTVVRLDQPLPPPAQRR